MDPGQAGGIRRAAAAAAGGTSMERAETAGATRGVANRRSGADVAALPTSLHRRFYGRGARRRGDAAGG
eukprot:1532584-Pleurochrysis_carterae.AAC.1